MEFSFVGTTGNASSQALGLSGEYIVRPDTWTIKNRAVFVRNESDGVLSAEAFQYLFRTEKALSARLSGTVEYGYFRDEFAGIAHQNRLTAGVSYKLIEQPGHLLAMDAGFGYLNEQRLVGDDVSSGVYGGGPVYRWAISKTAEFNYGLRLTGTFAEAEDWRLEQLMSVTARLTAAFSLKAGHVVRYANDPVPGFKDTDTTTSVALVAKF